MIKKCSAATQIYIKLNIHTYFKMSSHRTISINELGLRLTPTFHTINRNPLRFAGNFFLFKTLKRLTPTASAGN